jgi:DNA-binding transcriptional LysR family regulator
MLNPLLKTFETVAACGSFTRAAQQLFLSPTAVMKQMNTLEKQLGLQLIVRSSGGVTLTTAGRIVLDGARRMEKEGENILRQARQSQQEEKAVFRIGTSLLNPAKPFLDLWQKMEPRFPRQRLQLIPFEDTHTSILSEIEALGRKYDFLIGVCDSRKWLAKARFCPVGTYKKMVAVARDHPLARKKCLQVSDLAGQTLMMVPEGDSPVNDRIRRDLLSRDLGIILEDTPSFYDLSVFNACARSRKVLLTIACWKDVQPELVTLPVAWDYTIPYGLLYALEADREVVRFVQEVQEMEHSLKGNQ